MRSSLCQGLVAGREGGGQPLLSLFLRLEIRLGALAWTFRLKKQFSELDENGDGVITFSELKQGMWEPE